MNILVTGAHGQLARCLAHVSSQSRHSFTYLDRQALDITDETAVQTQIARLQPDIIINTAAYTAVDLAETHERDARQVNTEGVAYLARAADTAGAWLFHISTDFVFDGLKDRPYTEADAPAPLNIYGATKLEGEHRAAGCGQYLIIRTGWLFSEYDRNFFTTMLRLGDTHSQLRVVADQSGTPTYAGDLAEILLRLAEEARARPLSSGLLHFAGGSPCTWFDFARSIFGEGFRQGLLARQPDLTPITSAEYGAPARRPSYSVLDDSRLRNLLPGKRPDWQGSLGRLIRQRIPGGR